MIKKLTFILLLILFACNQNIENTIDILFEDYDGDVPGASIMVIKDGKKVFEKSYGLADLDKKIKITSKTNFRLASVTKTFTSLCILQLIEQGHIKFESSLCELFDDFPDYGKTITIKHLLQHTSGLIDYEDLIPDTATVQVLDKDVLDMMKLQDSTYFEPGTLYKYSNSGYAVLAMIIEKLSHLSFAKYLERYIFQPLEMTNTIAFEYGLSNVKNRAYGYKFQNDSVLFKDQSITSAVLGDGGIYSSTHDLYLWDQALYTNKLISTKTLDLAFSKGQLNNGDVIDYGLGWHLSEYKNLNCIYHTGSTSGFRNVLFRIPDKKFTIIILTNRAEPDLKQLAVKITEICLF